MYLEFYGFQEKPFSLTPNPRFVFLSKQHREAFAHILYGIDNRVGFIALTGEVGSGKTTVLRTLLNQLNVDHYRTALIFNPSLSPPELLQSINREFGIPAPDSHCVNILDALNLFLLQQNAEGRTVVLVIDEAQKLEPSVLEQVRLISNLETDKEKLIQIVLAGQPELVQILDRQELRQLNQRITVRYHLEPMDSPDTVDYINHRIAVAGGKGKVMFSRTALKRIYRYSRGLPRLLNAACDRALLAGYARDTVKITFRVASAGIKDLTRNTQPYPRRRRLILIPCLILSTALLSAGIYAKSQEIIEFFRTAQRVEARQEPTKRERANPREELSQTMTTELGTVPESESVRTAFNILAGPWKVPSVPEGVALDQFQEMERAARERKLLLFKFSGNLGALLRINSPAMLELIFPGVDGGRFISLVGKDGELLLIKPMIAGRNWLSFDEVERYWSGRAFLLWKDPLNLLTNTSQGLRGDDVKRLQGLLKEAGAQRLDLTGVYDAPTISAVKSFQLSKRIKPDGIVGSQTLMLLYQSVDHYAVPGLTAGQQ
jgi:general secretion pathway protein A